MSEITYIPELFGCDVFNEATMRKCLSDDVFQMNEGTLYPILHSLEKNGMLESYWSEASETVRRRKYYKITDKGLKELARQNKEWKEYSTAVSRVLRGAAHVTA